MDMAQAALSYADHGWKIFPIHAAKDGACTCRQDDCGSPAKHPRTPHGLKDATDDPDKIAAWWKRWPDSNIGAVTGELFDVLDIDGDEGRVEVERMLEQHGALPNGPISTTGGGGWHFLFQPTGVGNKAGLLPKVDWRGRGGYIVAPPSTHITGNAYGWWDGRDDTTDLEPVPPWLVDLLTPKPVERQATVSFLPPVSGEGTAYGVGALEAECDELARAVEGTRNDHLNTAAFNLFQLVAGRQLEEHVVVERLTHIATALGLPDREISATLASGRQAGLSAPRYPERRPDYRIAVGQNRPPPPIDTEPDPPAADGPQPAESKHDLELFAFLAQPENEFDWVIPGLIERGDRVILTGPEGGGKSTLLRQIAIQAAAGIHPFTLDEIDAVRTLLIDLENGRRHLRRQIRPLTLKARPRLKEGMCRVVSLPSGIDLLAANHVEWLERRFLADRPELVVVGPIYKMANGDPTEERVAKAAATTLDHLRTRFDCSLILEAHQPYASGGQRRPERPYGASLWSRWPEFGLHLSEGGDLHHWRGDRDERSWPAALKRGGEWPWTAEQSVKSVTYARLVEELQYAGQKLSVRQLAERLSCDRNQVQRAIEANRRHWDAQQRALPD